MGTCPPRAVRRTPCRGGPRTPQRPSRRRPTHKTTSCVLFPLNPGTLAKYREAFTPSHAKDDPTDAARRLNGLRKHRDKLPPLHPQSPAMRALAQLVAHRRRVVGDNVRLTHRLTSTLKHDFPPVLPWFEDKDTLRFCDFLAPWPTLKAAQLARRTTLEGFFRTHHVRDGTRHRPAHPGHQACHTADHRCGGYRPQCPLGAGPRRPAPRDPASHRRLRPGHGATRPEPPDFPLFAALPGAGAVFAPRLLVAFGEQRERYTSADALQKYAGIAPVTERRGNKTWVHWRWQCPTFLRQTFVEWAAESMRHCLLGTSVLPATARAGDVTSGRRPGPGVQMDPCPLSVLAASHTLRRIGLSHRIETPWFATAAQLGALMLEKIMRYP